MIKLNTTPLVRAAAIAGVCAALVLLILVSIISSATSSGQAFAIASIMTYVLAIPIFILKIRVYHPFSRLGAANMVTLARLVITCLLAGLAAELLLSGAKLQNSLTWFFFGIAALGTALDGLDGFLARRFSTESAFGARFDMEVDAFQIFCLAVITALLLKAGWWVLLSGLLRYAFVAAALVYTPLSRPLFPSWRRKFAAVVQNSVLVMVMIPSVTQPESGYVAALALALLVYSFSVDVLWLTLKSPLRPARLS